MNSITSGTKFYDGYYAVPYSYQTSRSSPAQTGFNIYDSSDKFKKSVATNELDNYINFLSKSDSSSSTSKGNENYFNSEEFKAFKDLSLDLAQKQEERDFRLMNQAAVKRNQEYGRNLERATSLYNAGQSTSLNGRGGGSSIRYDGMS